MFPATADDTTTAIGAAEHAGDMTRHDITTLAMGNILLYRGDPSQCCFLGYHSTDFEPPDATSGDRLRAYMLNVSTFLSFAFGGFRDIGTLSHEMAETFGDPFGDNETSWWLSTDPVLGGRHCQDLLETGDVIEVLVFGTTVAVALHGRTYDTGKSAEHIDADLHASRRFDAEQARSHGIIDRVAC